MASARCLATILAVAGYVTLRNVPCNLSRNVVAKTLRDKLHEALHSVTALLISLTLQFICITNYANGKIVNTLQLPNVFISSI